MIGNMSDMMGMIKKYKELQEVLQNTLIRAKQDGVIIDISAENKVKDVVIEDETLLNINMKSKLEQAIKAAFEKGQLKAQEIASIKMKEILGFDPSDMANMLGGGGMPKIPGLGL